MIQKRIKVPKQNKTDFPDFEIIDKLILRHEKNGDNF